MSDEGRSNVLSKWFGAPSPECVSDVRLTQWRGNHEEARAIARYFAWIAERNCLARRSQRFRTGTR
jgi:hypothetical protein